MRIEHLDDYRDLRRPSYPKLEEQVHALMKLADALRDAGVDLPPDAVEVIERIRDVKQRYPKP